MSFSRDSASPTGEVATGFLSVEGPFQNNLPRGPLRSEAHSACRSYLACTWPPNSNFDLLLNPAFRLPAPSTPTALQQASQGPLHLSLLVAVDLSPYKPNLSAHRPPPSSSSTFGQLDSSHPALTPHHLALTRSSSASILVDVVFPSTTSSPAQPWWWTTPPSTFAMASSSSSVPVAQAETFPDGTTEYVPMRKRNYDTRKPRRFPAVLPKKACARLAC